MSDDFDEILENLANEGDGGPVAQPTYRATIRAGKVMITGWAGWLTTWGPPAEAFKGRERAGVGIADLTVEGENSDELIVAFRSEGRSREEAEEALIEWAGAVGYRRLWLSDRVLEIEPDPERIARAEVRCPTCRAPWSDSSPEFWLHVRQQREFPRWCPVCGWELPQWTVRDPRTERGSRNPGRRDARSTSHDRLRHGN